MKQRFRRGRRSGMALIEFSLVTPLLLLALAGVLNYAVALRTASCLTDAARVGARYGSQSATSASDIAGMQAAEPSTVMPCGPVLLPEVPVVMTCAAARGLPPSAGTRMTMPRIATVPRAAVRRRADRVADMRYLLIEC